jgi:Asp-tRNA(Asn)/Glu-tRNA(Gln) amidotransferase C subunit
LELDDAGVEAMVRDLGAILAYADLLNRADLSGPVAPAAPGSDPGDAASAGRLRDDIVRPGLPPGAATREAPGTDHDLFRVPPVLGPEA